MQCLPARPPTCPSVCSPGDPCLRSCPTSACLLSVHSMQSGSPAARSHPSLCPPPRRRLVQAAFTPKAIRGYMPRMQVEIPQVACLSSQGPLPPASGAAAALALWACRHQLGRTVCAGPACRQWRRRRCKSGLHRATSCEPHPGAPQRPAPPWLAACLLQMPAVCVEVVCVCSSGASFPANCVTTLPSWYYPPSLPAAPTTR